MCYLEIAMNYLLYIFFDNIEIIKVVAASIGITLTLLLTTLAVAIDFGVVESRDVRSKQYVGTIILIILLFAFIVILPNKIDAKVIANEYKEVMQNSITVTK